MTGKKRVKSGGRDFEPGKSGNPAGRPPFPEEIRKARRLNQVELERILNLFLGLNAEELQKRVEDPNATSLERVLGSLIEIAIQNGDHTRLEFLLNRLIGKVRDVVAVEVTATPVAYYISSDGETVTDKNGTAVSPKSKMVGKPMIIERRDGSKVILGAAVPCEKEDE